MQAIVTKFIPATNYKGARIKAKAERGSVTISYPYNGGAEHCHAQAAQALVAKFVLEDEAKYGTPPGENSWSGSYVCGCIDGNYTFVRVLASSKYHISPDTLKEEV
jgi:hypothetical protein